MKKTFNRDNVKKAALAIDREIRDLSVRNVPNIRAVRRKYSRMLKAEPPTYVLQLAKELFNNYGHRWVAYELINNHPEALRCIGKSELMEFGKDINSWGAVDAFAGFLAGPAWLNGQIPDKLIHTWARSKDRWWRRTALVCTVVLNRPSLGGTGDVPHTLDVCRFLVDDQDDVVVKAMSWALRELIRYDAKAVRAFLKEYEDILASRVKREVMNKLRTGLKTPRRAAK